MRFCYAHRRFTLYPQSVDTWNLHPDNYTPEWLDRARDTGFDAIECGFEVLDKLGDAKSISDFGERVRSHGLKVGAIRAGGTLTEARHGPANREKLMRATEYAGQVGAEVVNGALSAPARYPGHPPGSIPGSISGWPRSQDSSKDAEMWVYDELASVFQRVCDSASEIDVTIEVHQNSPVDNSWSAVRVHEMIDRENFGINPDMGNVVWNYDVPEEDYDAAIDAMAPISKYWHCKNLHRVYHPENQRSVFVRVPLQDGEVDYRYAISAMADAGYSGYMAIEGTQNGDQWHKDGISLDYAKSIWAEFED